MRMKSDDYYYYYYDDSIYDDYNNYDVRSDIYWVYTYIYLLYIIEFVTDWFWYTYIYICVTRPRVRPAREPGSRISQMYPHHDDERWAFAQALGGYRILPHLL